MGLHGNKTCERVVSEPLKIFTNEKIEKKKPYWSSCWKTVWDARRPKSDAPLPNYHIGQAKPAGKGNKRTEGSRFGPNRHEPKLSAARISLVGNIFCPKINVRAITLILIKKRYHSVTTSMLDNMKKTVISLLDIEITWWLFCMIFTFK